MSSPGDAYEAYRNGSWLLEMREYRQAAIALERAKRLEPDKGPDNCAEPERQQ